MTKKDIFSAIICGAIVSICWGLVGIMIVVGLIGG